MATRKKVLSKKAMPAVECNSTGKKSGTCQVCGCCCGGSTMVESSLIMIFGGLVVALSFFLMQTML